MRSAGKNGMDTGNMDQNWG